MFDYGLEQTGGFETIAFCEIDKDCHKVLYKHWPRIPIASDVKLLKGTSQLPDTCRWYIPLSNLVDVVTASWPCQGHSVAGKKKGLNDERSGLWKETKRILQEIKPKWFIGENSANLRTTGLVEVLQDLREVGFNHIEWHIVSACAFGAIHRRERIYIIANRDGLRSGIETIASKEVKQERWPKTRAPICDRGSPRTKLYRAFNGNTTGLDEADRKRRMKQCGNSLYWPIVKYIGECILEYERGKND